jgi:hypothetical protein
VFKLHQKHLQLVEYMKFDIEIMSTSDLKHWHKWGFTDIVRLYQHPDDITRNLSGIFLNHQRQYIKIVYLRVLELLYNWDFTNIFML